MCSQAFFHDKEENRWYDKATKRKRSEKADDHKGKSRIIPVRVLSSILNQLCFHQIRHLGPTVKILGCLPGDAGSIPTGVAKHNGYGAFV